MKSMSMDSQELNGIICEAQTNGTAHRAAEKVRRYRERKKAGIIVVSVEIRPEVLEFFAWGIKTPVETLKGDRAQLANAVLRAIAKLFRDCQRHGKYPTDRSM